LILDKIVASKKEYIEDAKSRCSLNEISAIASDAQASGKFNQRSLIDSIRKISGGDVTNAVASPIPIVAEIKLFSPSGGQMNSSFSLTELATIYEQNGALAISVLTDEKYFGGRMEDLTKVKEKVDIPVLRKDFIIDEYQIYEAKAYGADLILLITAILSDGQIEEFFRIAHKLDIEVLIESHTSDELLRSIKSGAILQGINNRNLDTLVTDISTTEELLPLVPNDRIVVAESGIKNSADVERLNRAGARAFLVGESLLKSNDPGVKLAEMVYANVSK
jgi:indole-3-glycerol phosphate synthase